jgi:hypothetical protein
VTSTFPTTRDAFTTTHITGETIAAATDNDEADAINKIEALLGVQPDAPGNLGGTRTLNLDNAKIQGLVGTLSADHVLTITNLRAGAMLFITLIQDSTGGRAFSITVNSVTTVHAVNQVPLEPTTLFFHAISTTDYVLAPLGA